AAAAWQGLLLGAATAGLAWTGALLAIGVFHVTTHASALFARTALVPWAALGTAALLGLGWLTARAAMRVAAREAAAEREQAERRMREAISDIARQLVVTPVEQELSELLRFAGALAQAARAG